MELSINLKEYIPNEITIIPITLIPTALAESPPEKK